MLLNFPWNDYIQSCEEKIMALYNTKLFFVHITVKKKKKVSLAIKFYIK